MSNEVEAKEEEIEIPPTCLVHCPKVAFKLARLTECPGCEHFAGLQDRFPGGVHAFGVRYSLLCRHDPVKREIKELA